LRRVCELFAIGSKLWVGLGGGKNVVGCETKHKNIKTLFNSLSANNLPFYVWFYVCLYVYLYVCPLPFHPTGRRWRACGHASPFPWL